MLSPSRTALAVLFASSVGIAAIACGGGDDKTATPAPADSGAAPQSISELVEVDQVAVYQGVKVTLIDDAALATPGSAIIPKRPALVRIHARLPPKAKVPRLTAELHIETPGKKEVVLTDGPRTVSSTKVDDSLLTSTFNFELKAEQLNPGAKLSVIFSDPSGEDTTTLRFPAGDENYLDLNVGQLAPTLKVTFVPVRYKADGSNRLPDLDDSTVEEYKQALFKMYPVSEVEFTMRDALDWPLTVEPNGKGWDTLLQAIMKTRQTDKVADDVYYMGIFNPAATEQEYCRRGCVLGVAPASMNFGATDAVDTRSAMVVGYPSERAHGTMAQELAHAMGRLHAPCGGPAAIDDKYPYSSGGIGVFGYDLVKKELIDPDSRVFDFMSYCNPVWVSDYTFKAIYDRMVEVDKTKTDPGASPSTPAGGSSQNGSGGNGGGKSFRMNADGSMSEGPTFTKLVKKDLEKAAQTFVLPSGETVRGVLFPTSNIGGGYILPVDDSARLKLNVALGAKAHLKQATQ
jgi:hypothetical protein